MRRQFQRKVICCAAGLLALSFQAAAQSSAQPPTQDTSQLEIGRTINSANDHYRKGEAAYSASQYDRARREFDDALDAILDSSLDVRSDEQLSIFYRELIEKINRYQIAAIEQKDGAVTEQRHEPSPLDRIASLSDSDLQQVAGTADDDVTGSGFNFKFTVAPAVKQFVGYFSRGKGRPGMEAGFLRSQRYREMARRVFREEGVPTDLIWLAQIESGWNPYALSSAEAKGIWQFVPATGSRFGLHQDFWIDERSDPEKSTRAAARYLKWLANRYHDNWELALAAYNAGEGNVDSVIARTGLRDFWALHRGGYLPQETRNYVPAILAVVAIAKAHHKYGFEMPESSPYRYQTHLIAKQTDLHLVAKKLKVTFSSLLDMNPELQRGVTPPGKHIIRIPASALEGSAAGSPAPSATTPTTAPEVRPQ
ncbi:MAG TPA: lytic transglycosylase domain-containing protein [Blastocatellia bacterium]|nr:lytic transglycosylase domain-containing protein [Blastocatellia bacterium]